MIKRSVEEAVVVKKAHQITGYSRRHLQRIINGTHENEEIMNLIMFVRENENKVHVAAKRRWLSGRFEPARNQESLKNN